MSKGASLHLRRGTHISKLEQVRQRGSMSHMLAASTHHDMSACFSSLKHKTKQNKQACIHRSGSHSWGQSHSECPVSVLFLQRCTSPAVSEARASTPAPKRQLKVQESPVRVLRTLSRLVPNLVVAPSQKNQRPHLCCVLRSLGVSQQPAVKLQIPPLQKRPFRLDHHLLLKCNINTCTHDIHNPGTREDECKYPRPDPHRACPGA